MTAPPTCPNCHEPAPGGLYAWHPHELYQEPWPYNNDGVTHCGCFHEGDANGKNFHVSTEVE